MHNRIGRLSRLLLTSVALGSFGCGAALAQEANDSVSDEPGVGEIIVTAEKRSESASKVPMSITALSGEKLGELGIKEPRDLVKVTPSFTFADSQIGTPIYTLRGVGFVDFSVGGRPTVSIYVDEAPIPFAVATRGASLDLERVEVLKGPQGTLFGQNATGGAINYVAAKPTKDFQGGANFSFGNYNAIEMGAFVSGPISDTLGIRIAANHTQRDDWQRSYTGNATNGSGDFTSGRLLLSWEPTNTFKMQLNVSGYIDKSDSQAVQFAALSPNVPALLPLVTGLSAYPLAPQDSRAADFNPGVDYARNSRFLMANLRADLSLGSDLNLTSITSLSRYRGNHVADTDGTAVLNISYGTIGRINSFSQELRLSSELGGRGHAVVGVNYAHDKASETNPVDISQSTTSLVFAARFGLPVFTTFDNRGEQDVENIGVFGNIDIDLTDQLKVYGGVRYTDSENEFRGCTADNGNGNAISVFGPFYDIVRGLQSLPPNPPLVAGSCVTAGTAFVPGLVTTSLEENNVSWRIGTSWTPASGTMLYANVSKGFKAGGFPALSASTAVQLSPAQQESVVAYEAGFKTRLLGRAVQLNGAVFYYDYADKQVTGRVLDPVFGPLLKLVNVPESSIRGGEMQLTVSPTSGLTITAGGSYIKSEIGGNFTSFDATGALVNFDGDSFPNTPRYQFVADFDYRSHLTGRVNWFVGANANHQSGSHSSLDRGAIFETKGRTLVDLRAGLESEEGTWKFTIWGRNVFDEYYWTSSNKVLDTVTRYAGMPATYGAELSVKF